MAGLLFHPTGDVNSEVPEYFPSVLSGRSLAGASARLWRWLLGRLRHDASCLVAIRFKKEIHIYLFFVLIIIAVQELHPPTESYRGTCQQVWRDVRKLVSLASDGADDGIMKQSPMLARVMFSELVSAYIAFQNCL